MQNIVIICDERVCLSVCLSVSPHAYLRNHKVLCILVAYVRRSVLLWRRYNTLCTSGSVDDVVYSDNESCGGETLSLQPSCNVTHVLTPLLHCGGVL